MPKPEQTQEKPTPWVIATDLDGTLLDRNYDLEHAARVINRVCDDYSEVTQIVLATSKTLVELEPLAAKFERPPVLIFENGAGWAQRTSGVYTSSVIGSDYEAIRHRLMELRTERDFRFTGFGDMEVAELCALTALSADGAALAQQRSASEPLLWNESTERLQEFREALKESDLSLVRGGQFYHVSGADNDKAHALKDWHARNAPNTRIIACGDAPNDFQMLKAADRAIVFPNKKTADGVDTEAVLARSATTEHAEAAGPDGWLLAVNSLLASLRTEKN